MDTEYRLLASADSEAIIGFLRQAAGDTDYLPFSAAEIAESDYLYYRDSVLIGAFLSGRLAGVVQIIAPPLPRLRHRGTLFEAVLRDCWGKGIGSGLLSYAVEEAGRRGLSKIAVSLSSDNLRGKSFVLRHGFVSEGPDSRLFSIDGRYVDGERFSLIL